MTMNDKNNKLDILFSDENEETFDDYNNKLNSSRKKSKRNKRIKATAVSLAVLTSFGSGFLLNELLPTLNNNNKDINTNYYQSDKKNANESSENNRDFLDNNPYNNEGSKKNKENMSVEDIVKQVSPAVVTINVSNNYTNTTGIGTGFIVNKDGTLVTNYHVIENSNSVKVTFNNGQTATATIIATDKENDLAILKINESIEMPGVVKISEHDDNNAGQEIITIGNPLGQEFSGTVTKGIISSTNRRVNMDGIEKEFIQIDAAINPGNSGGPLINLHGEVIGVNTAKKSGDNIEGIGFSVPIKYVRNILNNLDKYKYHGNTENYNNNPWNSYENNNPWSTPNNDENPWMVPNNPESKVPYSSNGFQLGIQIIGTPEGPKVISVSPGGYGSELGLQPNDIIKSLNGRNISSVEELKNILSMIKSKDTLTFKVLRNNQGVELKIKVQ